MLMANAVSEAAATTPGKEAIAMESFAKALSELPVAIAENGGFDSAQLVSELRALHKQNKTTMGLGNYLFVSNKLSSEVNDHFIHKSAQKI